MKRYLTLCSLLCALMVGLWGVGAAQKGANFAGTWELDKSKSKLPQQMADNIQSLTWMVTQDDAQIKREQKMEGAMGGGGQGGGGGGRGGGMMGGGPLTVKLDGSETSTDVPRVSGKSTTKAKWNDGGKILELSAIVTGNLQGTDFKSTTTEHWELAEGGKVLKVHRISENPRGTTESTMVFNKK